MPNYTLSVTTTSGASADGKDTNSVTAILMSGNEYVSNAGIELTILPPGKAIFTGGS